MTTRHKLSWLVTVLVMSPLACAIPTAPALKYGLKGCEYYRGDGLCISVSAANREFTHVHALGLGCATNAAARPSIQEGTELSIVIDRGTISDLAFYLQCDLMLKGGVTAVPKVSELKLRNLRWEGTLGQQPAGPIPTREGREVWIVLKDGGSTVEITGE
jgi:hypothetical protein